MFTKFEAPEATDKQRSYISSLLDTRDVPAKISDAIDARVQSKLTRSGASQLIERLLTYPVLFAEPKRRALTEAEAAAYGKETGTCAICHRVLTNPESIERGIGPICADRMGW